MEVFLSKVFKILSIELTVMLTAALPIIELRGAIPIGISLGLSPIHATIISFIGSMIPVPFILFTIRPILNYLKKIKLLKNTINKITSKTLNNGGKIQKYGAWGLILFVGIPVPGTGVWSGSLAAALLNIRFKWAFPAILVGNIIAAILIMTLSHGVSKIFSFIP